MGVDYKILGKNIKFFRKQKKLTQEQMAEELDLSLGFVSQIERGVGRMSLDTLVSICDLLECSAGDVLGHSDASQYDIVSNDFLILYERLPRREQRLFYHMLKAYVEHL